MPASVEAYSVSRACATSYQSTINIAEAIMAGSIECGIAGGRNARGMSERREGRLASTPGVEHAAVTNAVPLSNISPGEPLTNVGR